MKHLIEKNEQYLAPDREILDVFNNPGVSEVTLNQKEFTSLCPLTSQPDYATITIYYRPKNFCVESKSLKLYLAAYRNFKGFAEDISQLIAEDLFAVLECPLVVKALFARRGGIDILATTERGWPND